MVLQPQLAGEPSMSFAPEPESFPGPPPPSSTGNSVLVSLPAGASPGGGEVSLPPESPGGGPLSVGGGSPVFTQVPDLHSPMLQGVPSALNRSSQRMLPPLTLQYGAAMSLHSPLCELHEPV